MSETDVNPSHSSPVFAQSRAARAPPPRAHPRRRPALASFETARPGSPTRPASLIPDDADGRNPRSSISGNPVDAAFATAQSRPKRL